MSSRQTQVVVVWLALVGMIWMGWVAPRASAHSIDADHVGFWVDLNEPDPDKQKKWHWINLEVTYWGGGPDPPPVFQLGGLLFEKGIDAGVGPAFDNSMFPPNAGYTTSTNGGEEFRVHFNTPIALPLMQPVSVESLGIIVSTHLDLLAPNQVQGFLLDTQGNRFSGRIIPEATTFALCGIGTLALLGYAWRRRKGPPSFSLLQ